MSKECISRNNINTQNVIQDVTFNDSETQKQQVTNRLMSKDEIVRKESSNSSLQDANRRVSKDDSVTKITKETSELKSGTLTDRNLIEVVESSQTSIKSYLRHLSSSETSVLGQIVRKMSDWVFAIWAN